MGRQIIELVQVLVDRIERNGYQQRAREDDITDVYKQLNEAKGQAKHWKAARDTAIEGGELLLRSNQSLQAEIDSLRQQLAEAHAPAMAQQSEEIAYLRARLDEERSVIASLQQQLDAQQQDVVAMRAEVERLRTFVEKIRDASWNTLRATAGLALAELDAQPAPVAETAEKRWFRSQVQIKECVSRATDGKLNKEAIEVWVSGQPADWTQTIKRADGQIPEWVWESVSRHMVCHVETRFNRQTEMMEFRNWEVFDKPTPVAEPLDAEGGK